MDLELQLANTQGEAHRASQHAHEMSEIAAIANRENARLVDALRTAETADPAAATLMLQARVHALEREVDEGRRLLVEARKERRRPSSHMALLAAHTAPAPPRPPSPPPMVRGPAFGEEGAEVVRLRARCAELERKMAGLLAAEAPVKKEEVVGVELERLREEKAGLEGLLAEAGREVAELKSALEVCSVRGMALDQERLVEQRQRAEWMSRAEDKEAERRRLDDIVTRQHNEIKVLMERIAMVDAEKFEAESVVGTTARETLAMREQVERIEADRRRLSDELDGLRKENGDWIVRMEMVEAERRRLVGVVFQLEATKKTTEGKVRDLESKLESSANGLREETQHFEARLLALQNLNQDQQGKQLALEREVSNLQQHLQNTQRTTFQQLADKDNELKSMTVELENLRVAHSQLEVELSTAVEILRLESQLSQLQTSMKSLEASHRNTQSESSRNLDQHLSVIKALEGEKAYLASSLARLEDEKASKSSETLKLLEDRDSAVRGFKEECERLSVALSAAHAKIESTSRDVNASFESKLKQSQELTHTLSSDLDSVKRLFDAGKEEKMKLEKLLESKTSVATALQLENARITAELGDAQKSHTTEAAKLAVLQKEVDDLKDNCIEFSELNQTMEDQLEEANKRTALITENLHVTQRSYDDAKNRCLVLENEAKQLWNVLNNCLSLFCVRQAELHVRGGGSSSYLSAIQSALAGVGIYQHSVQLILQRYAKRQDEFAEPSFANIQSCLELLEGRIAETSRKFDTITATEIQSPTSPMAPV
ncbi:hypothetical protein BC830DRAFT_415445 [Chytriomyces sp. MP71]|nr:hypothetical protein BC830DRAFT_415445 [Chytriomyces sp. MP71]